MGVKLSLQQEKNLNDILCRHKCDLPRNSYAGVYKVTCDCSNIYVGETKKKIATRINEHEQDVFKGHWEKSGITEHAKDCNQSFLWQDASTLNIETNYRRRKIREAIEIRKHRRSHQLVTNRDNGTIMKTSQWDTLLGILE